MPSHPVSPLGSKTRVLLTSVFGPYAQDDEFGSRTINPMELYQNQVTRVQGVFSLRMFHRSFGLMLMQANMDAPCTLLDFPTRDRFIEVLQENDYDLVGISSIMTNIGKVAEMCRLIRQHLPQATIVVGGHIANFGGIENCVDADHIVKGDGVRWFRRYLGQDENAPVRHPVTNSGHGTRILGLKLPDKPGSTAAMLIPSVGCPVGCNFCSTSAMFGGKGKSINFYETGDELFEVMRRLESELKVSSFFVMDENFLFHRKRALRLLELMEAQGKSWSLYVFSSAKVIRSYSMEQLIGLGISWVWMGLEGKESQYAKLSRVDTLELVGQLRDHGIAVLGSSIIGLEEHRPENLDEVIDYAVSHGTDFHQFMLYTPIPGTPLHAEHLAKGTLLDDTEVSIPDVHGQCRFNFRHAHIPAGQEQHYLLEAFQRDFKVNGPSLARLVETGLKGWQRYKNHENPRIRARYQGDVSKIKTVYAAAVWAMRKWYQDQPAMAARLDGLLKRFYAEFGWSTRVLAAVMGRYLLRKMKAEEVRLANGWSYEPQTFFEKNPQALALERRREQPATKPVSPLGKVVPTNAGPC